MVKGRGFLIGMLAWLLLAGIAMAQAPAPNKSERAARLETLFAELHTTKNADRGTELTGEIWQHWRNSGRRDVDSLTSDATRLMAIGQLEAARTVLDRVVALAPDHSEGWNMRATVLYLIGEHALSLIDIDQVLKLEPRHFGALSGQGLIHLAARRWALALISFRRAVAVNPFLAERTTVIPDLERKVEGQPL